MSVFDGPDNILRTPRGVTTKENARPAGFESDLVHPGHVVFVEFHSEIGIHDDERAAIDLLPSRLADVYPSRWDSSVWKVIDRQVDVAAKVGVLAQRPSRQLYDAVALGDI